jgi:electron transport complex protein RnfG
VSRTSATVVSLRTAGVLLVFVLAFTLMMALAHLSTRDIIAASAEAEKMKLVSEILPPGAYDNALLADWVETARLPEIGLNEPSRIFRARRGGLPVALVLEAIAPDGYSGRIRLIVAVRTGAGGPGEIAGVRVTLHKETPGLGDYIDIRKDKNKARPWITQFNDLGYAQVAAAQWTVKKDGGRFEQVTGATVTARAVTLAIGRALKFADANRDALFAAPTGAKWRD